jgi:glycosyltransferase involved in cell wall biosynthesis
LVLLSECIREPKQSMNARALLLLPESPYPPHCGNALRDAQQIYLLRQMGFEVCLALMMHRHDLTPFEESRALDGMTARYAGTQNGFRESLPAILWRKAGYLLGSRRNAFAWWAEHAEPASFLARVVGEIDPAVVLVRSLFVHLLPELRRVFPGPVIVDCHDADVHLAGEMVRMVSSLRKLGPWANLQAVRRACRAYLPVANEVWAVSDEDARRIRKEAPSARILVVPSGLEPLADPRARPGDDRTVLIVANYGYGPNTRGVEWLLANVWPTLHRRDPHIRVELVGGRMPQSLQTLASRTPGVRVHGMVEKLDTFYDTGGVVAVPIFEGSGTRLKIVDAWRYGKAVIATSKAVEGLPMEEGVAAVADDPNQFAAHTIELLQDRERRREVGEMALRHFRTTLSWEKAVEVVAACSVLRRPVQTSLEAAVENEVIG